MVNFKEKVPITLEEHSMLHLTILKQPPEIFFNQQGGKNHRFEVQLQVVDNNGQLVELKDYIPIAASLYYHRAKELVKDQSILQNMHRISQLSKNGCGSFFFRINSVSKNHMNRRFAISFEARPPNRSDGNLSIEPVMTTPILVRSKEGRRYSACRLENGRFSLISWAMKVRDVLAWVEDRGISRLPRAEIEKHDTLCSLLDSYPGMPHTEEAFDPMLLEPLQPDDVMWWSNPVTLRVDELRWHDPIPSERQTGKT
jgi:hypothetical protein